MPSQPLPHVGNAGRGVHRTRQHGSTIAAYFAALAARLRRVRVCCGDWTRVVSPSVTVGHGMTAVFLDPPYPLHERDAVYAYESHVFADVRQWAIAHGNNPLLRIAICGYDFPMPDGWIAYRWRANGGYARSTGRGRANAAREVVWFSPHCLHAIEDLPLWTHQEAQDD